MKSHIVLLSLTLILLLSLIGCSNKSESNSADSADTSSASSASPVFSEITPKTEGTSETVFIAETFPAAETVSSTTVLPVTETTEPIQTGAPPHKAELTSLTVPADKNKNICETIVGQIYGDTVILNISAPTDTYSLREAVVDVETTASSFYFSNGNGETVNLTSPDGCFCTIVDDSGETRTYSILIEYSENIIPVISINTNTGEAVTSKETYVDAVISIDTAGVNGWYLPEGFESLEPTQVLIKGRGNSTWNWDKKPYKLKFNSKTEVLGLTAAKKWVLLANYSDYSLMRNYVACEASKVLSEEISPLSQYPVNVFLNGEYQGVYTIGEDHEVKNGRVDIEKNNGTVNTSYMLEVGGYNTDEPAFETELIRACSIEYPEQDVLTQEQIDYISAYIKDTDTAIKNLNGYENYIDVDSLIDWFISNELFYNLESCFRRSCFITKEPDGLLKMGPMWDFDLAMGNLYNDFGLYNSWACLTQEYEYIGDNWFCYLMNDESFRTRLRGRWNEVKDDLLNTTLYHIDKMGETLSPSARYNFELWNILGTRAVAPQPLNITDLRTYDDNVRYIRDFIVNRWNWMDANI